MFFDHFTSRGLQGWAVPKGDWRIQRGTWLVLTSGGPQRGSEVQSVQTFTFGSLLVRAKSGNWSHDTSIGFESFSGPYKGVVVKNGGLHISRAHQSHEIKIVDWNEVRKRENVFWLIWREGCVELHIADHEHVYSHASHRVPHEPLRVRLNASNDCRDTLMVDYVAVLPWARIHSVAYASDPLSPARDGLLDRRLFQQFAQLDLRRIAVMAAIRGPRLRRVGSAAQKISAARKDQFVDTVVVSAEQELDPHRLGLEEDPRNPRLFRDPDSGFRVIRAGTITDAIELLVADEQTRWGNILDQYEVLAAHRDYVGRDWLRQTLLGSIRRESSGYFLLTATPGVGKTAFVVAQVQSARARAVVHFINRDRLSWCNPDAFLSSLTAQLRRKHSLPRPAGQARTLPSEEFLAVLQRVSRKLGKRKREIIYLDGLDEAFGPTGAHSHDPLFRFLPRILPPGIFIVVTSRPGEHLDCFDDPGVKHVRLDIDARGTDNLRDIRAYLRQQDKDRQLHLGNRLREHLAQASEGVFAAATRYLRDRPGLAADLDAWRRDPATIPRGIWGWFDVEWKRLIAAATKGRTSAAGSLAKRVVQTVLALLATAMEPVSRADLRHFVSATRAQRRGRLLMDRALVRQIEARLDEMLDLCREFFDPLDPMEGAEARYQFYHSALREFILDKLWDSERLACHHLLARGCAAWEKAGQRARRYAFRHRLAHLIAAGQWRELVEAFGDGQFIVERSRCFGFPGIHGDALAAVRSPDVPARWSQAFEKWERFLRWRGERLDQFPAVYAQEVSNEFLLADAGALAKPLQRLHSHGLPGPVHLRKCCGPPALSGASHAGYVRSLAVSPDRRWIASGGSDRAVKVWDAATLALVADCVGHQGGVNSVAFSPDSLLVASGSDDGTVRVWEAETGRLVARCDGHASGVSVVVFAPDGALLASASGDGSVRVWDPHGGAPVAKCEGHRGPVTSIAFSPDGSTLASGSDDSTVKLWVASSGDRIRSLRGHKDGVTSVAFSRKRGLLASGSHDGTAKVWDVLTRKRVAQIKHTATVRAVAFAPNGRILASGGDDGTIRFWDAMTGRESRYPGPVAGVVNSLDFSTNGRFLACGTSDGAPLILNARTAKLVKECAGRAVRVNCAAFSADSKFVVAGLADGTIRKWSAATGRAAAPSPKPLGRVNCAAFSADGQFVAFGGEDAVATVRQASRPRSRGERFKHMGAVISIALAPNDRLLASGSVDNTLRVWRLRGARGVPVLVEHAGWVHGVAFSPDGERVASASGDGSVTLCNARTGGSARSCKLRMGGVRSIAFSHNGRCLACGGHNGSIRLLEVVGGRLQPATRNRMRHTRAVISVAFAPRRGLLAAGDEGGVVKLWDYRTGDHLADLAAGIEHAAAVRSVAFSNDGRLLASASADGMVRIWDTTDRRLVNVLFFESELVAVGFVAHRRRPRLAVADRGGRMFQYDILRTTGASHLTRY